MVKGKKTQLTSLQRQLSDLKKQLVKIGLGVAHLLKVVPTLTAKEEMGEGFLKVNREFAEIREEISDLQRMTLSRPDREEMRRIINAELNKAAVTLAQLQEHETKLENHEKRIGKLEASVP